ncbi:TonB-dependent receptor plug domain-containing protein [Campylobacter sp. MG1]|uniref:TonB-dependent receptor plug domain-containing protein n=1 Tax=Campylobacter sp. MG1 TaxID=2976332 RepID=UPI00226D1C31|nr:TonB-dependent receptor plug domain-containing protein [Campylobacter sp. MG1]
MKFYKIYILVSLSLNAVTLDEIHIYDNSLNTDYIGFSSTLYNKEYINNQNKINHSLDELLKKHTNIRVSVDKNTTNSYSLKPEDFSINGAKTYQNQMYVDGINITSTIAPNRYKYLYKNVWFNPSLGSYGLNIDSSLLENLNVHDSFVSASYGGFLGGVIDGKIKNPTKKPSGAINMSYTTQENAFIDEKIRQNYSTGYGYQDFSNYYKRYLSADFSSYLNDTFGFLFFVSDNYSKAKVKKKDIYTIDSVSERTNTILLKTQKDYENHTLYSVFLYNPMSVKQFQEGVINSNMNVKYGGYSIAFNLESNLKNLQINQHLSFLKSNSSRIYDNKVQYQLILPSGAKQSYGGLGDTLQKEKSYQYKIDLKTNEFKAKNLTYDFNFGFEFIKNQGEINRISPYTRYENPTPLQNNLNCKLNDKSCINNQYFQYYETHYANSKKYINNYGVFIEGNANYDNFRLRLGLRGDYDSLSKKFNLAPRSGVEYYLSDNQALGFGFNKYFDKGLLTYLLFDDYFSGYEEYTRTSYDDTWVLKNKWKKDRVFKGLKSPYANEFSVYYNAEFNYFKMLLKYVKRKTYNEIYSSSQKDLGLENIDGVENNYSVYHNDKKTNSDIISLNLSSSKPLNIFNTQNYFDLNLSYIHKTGSTMEYSSNKGYDIIYHNKIIKSSELPFIYEPFTANLTHTLIYNNFKLNNYFTFHSSSNNLFNTYDNALKKRIYSDIRLKHYYTWDLGLSYIKKLKNNQLIANFNISNITNSKNTIGVFNCNNEVCFNYDNSRTYNFNISYIF